MRLKDLAVKFNIFSNDAGGAPKKITTSRFDNQAGRDFLHAQFDHDDIRKNMIEGSQTTLSAHRNRDGSYDVLANYTVYVTGIGPDGGPYPEEEKRSATVRYGLSLQRAVQELEDFEDAGIAGIKIPNESDRPAYVRRHFTDRYAAHNVKRIKKDYAAAISGSARLTAARIKQVKSR